MKDGAAGRMIYRRDYTPYPWDVSRLDLFFAIGRETTLVRAEMAFQLKDDSVASGDIVLNGHGLDLVSLSLNGRQLVEGDYVVGIK